MAKNRMPHRQRRLSQRAWDLIIEATVIVTASIISTLILVLILHVP